MQNSFAALAVGSDSCDPEKQQQRDEMTGGKAEGRLNDDKNNLPGNDVGLIQYIIVS